MLLFSQKRFHGLVENPFYCRAQNELGWCMTKLVGVTFQKIDDDSDLE